MADDLRYRVEQRAKELCEYCHARQIHFPARFQVDHVIARQHGGVTVFDNLALCCLECNLRKGPNIAGVDPQTNKVVPLFNPRTQKWHEHFEWSGPRLLALTQEGRATVRVLDLNRPLLLAVRRHLIERRLFPPRIDLSAASRKRRRDGQ